jgi:hypothetical protein
VYVHPQKDAMLAFVRQLNIPVVAQEGEEADDVIAS